jgi:uncharacterized SAM-binding protein YcdF (DUF218 family)
MLTILSKFIALPFYPVGLTIALLIAGCISTLLGKQKRGIVLTICAGLLLYLFSSGPLPDFLVRSLENKYAPLTVFPPATAIVLLSGGEIAKAPPRLYDEINAAGDRILYAARLARAHVAPRLIITGGNIDCIRTITGSQAEASYRLCTEQLGVDSSCILLENKARNTYENGLFTKQLLDSLKLPPTVILVTSALHMPRSVAIFKKLGMTVIPAPTDFLADNPPQFKIIQLFPTAGSLDNSSNVLHEIYGIIAYKLMGRL